MKGPRKVRILLPEHKDGSYHSFRPSNETRKEDNIAAAYKRHESSVKCFDNIEPVWNESLLSSVPSLRAGLLRPCTDFFSEELPTHAARP